MRILRVMVIGAFVAVAAAFGLVVALTAAAAGAIALAVRRWLGHDSKPVPSRHTPARARRAEADVIDVAATEVQSGPAER